MTLDLEHVIKLPAFGPDLDMDNKRIGQQSSPNVPYQTRVYGRVLDLITPLEIKDDVQMIGSQTYINCQVYLNIPQLRLYTSVLYNVFTTLNNQMLLATCLKKMTCKCNN